MASPQAADEAVASRGPHDEASAVTPEAADDDAVLDRIAFEMAADDPDDTYDDVEESHVAEPPLAAPEMIAEMPGPIAAPAPAIQPSHLPSLGSALIANGIVRRPHAPASDPLAPIRRMSQAEKIAFFS
jgi:hypothetical protein